MVRAEAPVQDNGASARSGVVAGLLTCAELFLLLAIGSPLHLPMVRVDVPAKRYVHSLPLNTASRFLEQCQDTDWIELC
jgi:hypothetical protein